MTWQDDDFCFVLFFKALWIMGNHLLACSNSILSMFTTVLVPGVSPSTLGSLSADLKEGGAEEHPVPSENQEQGWQLIALLSHWLPRQGRKHLTLTERSSESLCLKESE